MSVGAASAAFPIATTLALGASFVLVTRLERMADRLKLTEAVLGLLVALAADGPEITSAVTASVHGQHTIGAGVVLGSNVFNLAALLGLGAIVAGRIELHRRVIIVDGVVAIWVAAVSVLVVSSGFGAGPGLLVVLVVVIPYAIVSAVSNETLGRVLPAPMAGWLRQAIEEEEAELAPAIHPAPGQRLDGAVALIALAIVIGASTVMERSAETLGRHFGWSNLIVGGVILAAVTSLPNAVGAVYLGARGRGAAVLSEAMNSNMINVVAGLLLPALFIGLGGSNGTNTLVAVWYVALTAACLSIAFRARGLSRLEGVLVVAAYGGFLAMAVSR